MLPRKYFRLPGKVSGYLPAIGALAKQDGRGNGARVERISEIKQAQAAGTSGNDKRALPARKESIDNEGKRDEGV
ncbi:hypothetical protein [Pseudoduganella umbonata]|uniref:Uncharacterized protein n=1 Tax=Pseudoduganella umbonata TaxID=864828 RepID=A0A4P8HHR3_9BURK|nr:hypothetical protein [Pseudoduganella umbonata]MBB3221748.1 hypothetical protein [Pseudoduganella umbonata]QCP09033.1 hypothetical protein FCL38_00230 [Pseudoduganella umbonata]